MKKTVLVVEDEVQFREIVVETLREAEYEVYECNNGQEALDLLAKHKIDIVLSDIKMPVMNGLDLLKHVQSLEGNHPQMILMTGHSTMTPEEATKAGAVTIISKPNIWDVLLNIISSVRLH